MSTDSDNLANHTNARPDYRDLCKWSTITSKRGIVNYNKNTNNHILRLLTGPALHMHTGENGPLDRADKSRRTFILSQLHIIPAWSLQYCISLICQIMILT